jgi:hypothetical protein
MKIYAKNATNLFGNDGDDSDEDSEEEVVHMSKKQLHQKKMKE